MDKNDDIRTVEFNTEEATGLLGDLIFLRVQHSKFLKIDRSEDDRKYHSEQIERLQKLEEKILNSRK